MKKMYSLVWLRRDLRLDDNAAIYHAIQLKLPIIIYFNFDTDILDQIDNKSDSRLSFIHKQIKRINKELANYKSSLLVKTGSADECFLQLLHEFPIANVVAGKDYEPFAIQRDERIKRICQAKQIDFKLVKDQVIFEKKEIIKKDGNPYSIYTPYMKKWKEMFLKEPILPFQYKLSSTNFASIAFGNLPSLNDLGFTPTNIKVPEINISANMLENYNEKRNYPALNATSNLGIYLRFGTVSIRQIVEKIQNKSPQFLNELIWREFFMQILANFPDVQQKCFKSKYEQIKWINNEEDFEKWKNGTTGYPIVDAGMRELLATGNMHNRVRMITASFLVKHLLIDWRWGEVWFANHLLDYDLASNNGNWQWVAGCGCDAAPYFRVFNPTEQQKKFDPDFEYIKKWVPELGTDLYPKPMIDHKFARNRALDTYKKALQSEMV